MPQSGGMWGWLWMNSKERGVEVEVRGRTKSARER